jgi:hypothetical protein
MSEEEKHQREQARLMRVAGNNAAPSARQNVAPTLALALWGDNEVGSASTEQPPRPQEGHDSMATATKNKKSTPKAEESNGKASASSRRGRGQLEKLVQEVTDAYEDGKLSLPEDRTLTPTVISAVIGEKDGEEKPSAGAVTAILKRWEEVGYALTHEGPFAFKRLSAAGKKQGLEALKEKHREKNKAARAAAKEEKTS